MVIIDEMRTDPPAPVATEMHPGIGNAVRCPAICNHDWFTDLLERLCSDYRDGINDTQRALPLCAPATDQDTRG